MNLYLFSNPYNYYIIAADNARKAIEVFLKEVKDPNEFEMKKLEGKEQVVVRLPKK